MDTNEARSIFKKRFSGLRGERTQAQFAEFLGIARPTVGFYENGERIPDAQILAQIATRCDVSADWLLGLSPERSRDLDVQALVRETGLSGLTTKILRKDAILPKYREMLNALIERGHIWGVFHYAIEYAEHDAELADAERVLSEASKDRSFSETAIDAQWRAMEEKEEAQKRRDHAMLSAWSRLKDFLDSYASEYERQEGMPDGEHNQADK